MTLDELPEIWKEALAMHSIMEMFVEPDQIFITYIRKDGSVIVTAKSGEVQAPVRIGQITTRADSLRPGEPWFMEQRQTAVEIYNSSDQYARRELVDSSETRRRAVDLIGKFIEAGLRPKESK